MYEHGEGYKLKDLALKAGLNCAHCRTGKKDELGTFLLPLAGRSTKAQFIPAYGPKGPKMPWAARAEAGVGAKHLQAALAAKGGPGNANYNSEALGRTMDICRRPQQFHHAELLRFAGQACSTEA